jgi:hypothetical protein
MNSVVSTKWKTIVDVDSEIPGSITNQTDARFGASNLVEVEEEVG